MPQIIEQGDIFGRIGKAIGQGVSEQAERSQLARSLEGIQGVPKEIGKILRQPGGQQALPTVLPYIQNRGASEQILKQAGISPEGQPTQVPFEQQPKTKIPSTRPERLTENPEEIRIRGAKTQLENPLAYPTLASAIEYEKGRVTTQQNQIKNVREDFDSITDALIQKGGTEKFSDVLGELQEKFRTQAEDAVLSGKMTEKEAARHYGDQALNFAKARNKFTVPGRDFWRSLVGSSPLKEVQAAKKAYDDAGVPEAFLNDLVAKRKFSLPVASEIAFPPTDKAKGFFNGLKYSGSVQKDDPKIYDEAMKLLSPRDSLQTFASQLKRKGYAPLAFLDYAASNGTLTPFQERELENYGSFQPSLSDVLYFTMSGKKP